MFKWLLDWGEEVKNRFVAVVPGYFGGDWVTRGVFAIPQAGDILADTEALPAGVYDFYFIVTGTVGGTHEDFLLQHRNAANDTTLKVQGFPAHANINPSHFFLGYKIKEGERLRIVVDRGLLNPAQASIWYVRRFPLKRGQ